MAVHSSTLLRLFILVLAASATPLRAAAPPADPLARVESLLALSQAGKLTDALASEAAGLLDDPDPFVAGVAEWAIATRVERDNSGPRLAWPRANPPQWFARWSATPREKFVEMDYVRQAVQASLHRDPKRLQASAADSLRRAEAVDANAASLVQMRALHDQLASGTKATSDDMPARRRLWLRIRLLARPVVLGQPGVGFHELLFVKVHPGHSLQNITGACYPWTHKPGGGIFIQNGLEPHAPARDILREQLGPGHVHGVDLWWDADRIVFGYAKQPAWPPRANTQSGDCSFELRKEQPPTNLYEIRVDGSAIRAVTHDTLWSSFEPAYLPDGGIAFASDRSMRSSQCGKFSADHTVVNLYRCGPDGSGLRRLSDNKDIDRHPHTLDNGLIAYTHWEYQERHFLQVHGA